MTMPEELCFVWQTDAQGRFTVASDAFARIISPDAAAALGRRWSELSAEFDLDPAGRISRALAGRNTWTGIPVSWPARNRTQRVDVEMSGLPEFDTARNFVGYRGFAWCRGLGALSLAPTAMAAEMPESDRPGEAAAHDGAGQPEIPQSSAEPVAPPAAAAERPGLRLVPVAKNVVPFRSAQSAEARTPMLSPIEHHAFSELARQLSQRLSGVFDSSGATPPAADELTAPVPGGTPAPDEESPDTPPWLRQEAETKRLLDRLPFGLLIYRIDRPLYANQAFLDRTGFATLAEFVAAGGLDRVDLDAGAARDTGVDERLLVSAHAAKIPARVTEVRPGDETIRALILLDRPRDAAEPDPAANSALLADLSGEMRQRLATIVEFAELMLEERYGPIGNERYRARLGDIRASATQSLGLLGDLTELSKQQPSRATPIPPRTNLNEAVRRCIAEAQPHASRRRILIRAALAPDLPAIVADAGSVAQMVQNLLASALDLASPGGQVIVSTAISRSGEAVLRLRDTGRSFHQMAVGAPTPDISAVSLEGPASGERSFAIAKALARGMGAALTLSGSTADGHIVEIAFAAMPAGAS